MSVQSLYQKIGGYLLSLFVFLLPWQTRWIWRDGVLNDATWEYGRFSLYALDFLWLVLILFSVFFGRRLGSHYKRWWVTIGLFLFIGFVSLFSASHTPVSWYAYLRLLQGVSLVWVVGRLWFRWRDVGIALVSAGVIQSALAIWQFFSQEVMANKWLGMAAHLPATLGDIVVEADGGRFLRAYGSLPHPNMLAGFLVVCIIVCIGFLFAMYRSKQPPVGVIILTVTAFVLMYYGLILTFSRSAWIALLLVLAGMFVVSLWQRDRYRLQMLGPVVFWIVLVSAFSVIMIPEIIAARTIDSGRLEVMSAYERADQFVESFDLIAANPLDGVGVGSATYASYELNNTLNAWEYQPVHNLYVLATVETGVFGGALFFFLIYQHFAAAFYRARRALLERYGFFTYTFAFFALVLVGIFEHFLWSLPFGIFFWWFIFGLWLRKYSDSVFG